MEISFPIVVSLLVALSFVIPEFPGFKMFAMQPRPFATLYDAAGVEIPIRAQTYKALYGIDELKAVQFADWLCSTKRNPGPFQIVVGEVKRNYQPIECEQTP